jgi:hypothetical protein
MSTMKQLTHSHLMRRYLRADPAMQRDFRAVAIELGFITQEIQALQEVFNLDNDNADPHDELISLSLLEAWKIMVNARRRHNRSEAVLLLDTLADIKMAIEARKSGE